MPWQQPSNDGQLAQPKMPDGIRPYDFLGLDLDWLDRRTNEPREHCPASLCPWCGREGGKFTVTASKGTAGCFVCGWKGNALEFMRKLWDESDKATNGERTKFAAERGLLDSIPIDFWGICRSVLDGSWLVPGHDPASGKLVQLYKRIKAGQRWEMRPTPTLGHALIGVPLFDKAKPEVHLHESWGNALAFWEALRIAKREDDGSLAFTANPAASLLERANVLAVANCGAVGEPLRRQLASGILGGKRVTLWFDSDHPTKTGADGGGLAAAKRAAAILHELRGDARPESVHWMPWSLATPGWDAALKPGFDVRDVLSAAKEPQGRVAILSDLLHSVQPVPAEWLPGRTSAEVRSVRIEPKRCERWADVVAAWRKALHWRRELGDALAVMLAVCASTSQRDDQLMLQVVGDPGSAKSRLCEGLLVSDHCHALDTVTSFVSGWKDASGDDHSFLARVNHKTLITTEGDVLVSLPNFQQIMSQLRKVFDGSLRAVYGNRKEDLVHDGLRLPWIMCGTPALLDGNQARLGDRFLRFWIGAPSFDEQEQAARMAFFSMQSAVRQRADGTPDSCVSEELLAARRATGGYVDWLRANVTDELNKLETDAEELCAEVLPLARFAAVLRAKPIDASKEDKHDSVEQPNRLIKQFSRLVDCLAVVLNERDSGNAEPLRVLRRVAVDTARGRTLDAMHAMRSAKDKQGKPLQAISLPGLCIETDRTEGQLLPLLQFLRRVGAVKLDKVKHGLQTRHLWRLSPSLSEVWAKAMENS